MAMATPVEVVDDAVLSGRTRTTNNHAIAATHQAADSNAALPRRERGAANAEAWRGDDVASALARGHGLLGSGGGGIGDGVDADLLRKCCSVGSCCSRRAPGSWVRLHAAAAASTTSCLARLLSVAGSSLQSGALRAVARQACLRALPIFVRSRRSAVARRPNQRVARRAFALYHGTLIRGIHTGTLPMVSQRHIMALQVLRFPGSRAAYHRDVQPTVPQ